MEKQVSFKNITKAVEADTAETLPNQKLRNIILTTFL